LSSIFRTIHTIKGTCGFLGFGKLEAVAHAGENLLSRLRDGELVLNPEITTGLLQMVDAIRQMLEKIDASGNEGERDDSALIETLKSLQQGESATARALGADLGAKANDEDAAVVALPTVREETTNGEDGSQPIAAAEKGEPAEAQAPIAGRSGIGEASIRVDVGLLDKLMNLVGELVLARNQIVQFTNATDDNGLTASSQRLNLITTEL